MFKDLSTPTPPCLHLCYPACYKIRKMLLLSQHICEQSLENLKLMVLQSSAEQCTTTRQNMVAQTALWGGKSTGILLHLLNQSSQTLSVCTHTHPDSLSLRNEGSTVLSSTEFCCSPWRTNTSATSAPSWQTDKHLRESGSGSHALSELGETPSTAKFLLHQH